jgi:hypothetical protein
MSGEQLYTQYKTILKENCIRSGKEEKTFVPAKVRTHFMAHLHERGEQLQQNSSLGELNNLLTECKSYLMVLTWLHRLSSLEAENEESA